MPARKVTPVVPEPELIRRIDGSFAWLDHRLMRDGIIETLSLLDVAVYVFLVLAADRNGVSFYRKDVICKKLGLDWDAFEQTKQRLLGRRLIAFRPFTPNAVDGFCQVLPVPRAGGAPRA